MGYSIKCAHKIRQLAVCLVDTELTLRYGNGGRKSACCSSSCNKFISDDEELDELDEDDRLLVAEKPPFFSVVAIWLWLMVS